MLSQTNNETSELETPASEEPVDEESTENEPDERALRQSARKGFRAIEVLREVYTLLGAEDDEVTKLLAPVEERLEALKPPEKRKCKEYKRALTRARKGLVGIDPDEVVLYCACRECKAIREKQGLAFRGRTEADDGLLEDDVSEDEEE